MIFNKQYSKEEYERFKADYQLDTLAGVAKMCEQVASFFRKFFCTKFLFYCQFDSRFLWCKMNERPLIIEILYCQRRFLFLALVNDMKKRFFVSTLLAFLAFSFVVTPFAAQAAAYVTIPPSVPTIVVPDEGFRAIVTKPLIRGVTENDTTVTIYVDGAFSGHATVKNGTKGTASFAYTPSVHLRPGFHTVQGYATDLASGMKSAYSEAIRFEVEHPYPAPMLFQPVVNEATVSTQPFIVGLVRNNSLVKVVIDGKLDGQFWVREMTDVDVVDFSYKPTYRLDVKKSHLVYATATDVHGKVSGYSNAVGFMVRAPKPTVATTGTNMSSATNSSQNSKQSVSTSGEQSSSSITDSGASFGNANVNSNSNGSNNANTNSGTINGNTNGATSGTTNANEAVNTNDSTQPDPNQTSDRSWILWAIVVVMVLVILFRNRGEIQKSLMGDDEQMKASEEAAKKMTNATEGSEKKDENNPPSPPSSPS